MVKRKHDKPMTPCDWLLHRGKDVDEATKQQLRAQRAALNSFTPHREIEDRLRSILHRALHCSRPTDTLHSAPDAGNTSPAPVSSTFEATGDLGVWRCNVTCFATTQKLSGKYLLK